MKRTTDEKLMKPYLTKLLSEHRMLNRIIDNAKALGRQNEVKQLKRVRLNVKDRIAALQRHYYGRSAVG